MRGENSLLVTDKAGSLSQAAGGGATETDEEYVARLNPLPEK